MIGNNKYSDQNKNGEVRILKRTACLTFHSWNALLLSGNLLGSCWLALCERYRFPKVHGSLVQYRLPAQCHIEQLQVRADIGHFDIATGHRSIWVLCNVREEHHIKKQSCGFGAWLRELDQLEWAYIRTLLGCQSGQRLQMEYHWPALSQRILDHE